MILKTYITVCLSAIVLLMLSASGVFSAETNVERKAYWIFLADRPATKNEVAYIDPHALERRLMRGTRGASGELDLPVEQQYKDAVTAIPGVALRGESRWFNALSVEADPEALDTIQRLNCVQGIQAVAVMDRTDYTDHIGAVGNYERRTVNQRLSETPDEPFWHPTQPDPAGPDYKLDRAWYGPSLNQVRMANALEAHFRGNHGAGVRIAVLDGGYQLNHEAFDALDVIAQYDFINNDDDSSWDPAQDVKGQPNHGTACMSVIGAYCPGNLIGLAHEASFILCKTEYVPTETIAEEDYWIRALEWAESLGADVLSSSLSYKDWYALSEYDGVTSMTSRAAMIAYELGMVLCTSAGNEGPKPMSLGVPTDSEGILSIGALRPNGDLARFSSRGPTADGRIKPDICAQGVRTACVTPHSWNRYSFWNGTSLSCPVAAGCCALILHDHPDWSPSEVYEAVRETGSHAERPDSDWGWGAINTEEAIHFPSVSGWVLDEDGRGLPGIKLKLFGEVHSFSTHTTDDGFYRFPNLQDSEVRIQVVWEDGSLSPFTTLTMMQSHDLDFMK